MPRIVEVLAKVEEEPEPDHRKKLERAKREADLASSEGEAGFPLLHAQSTIALWAILEAAVRHLVANWIRFANGANEVKSIQQLKVRIGDIQRLNDEERAFFIADRLEQEIGGPMRQGVGRFEGLLEPFGLSGAVPAVVKERIYELSHVRNVLVHGYGLADRRFVEACPHLGFKVQEQVVVSHKMFEDFMEAVISYATILVVRLGELHGVSMDEFKEGVA